MINIRKSGMPGFTADASLCETVRRHQKTGTPYYMNDRLIWLQAMRPPDRCIDRCGTDEKCIRDCIFGVPLPPIVIEF